MINHHSTKLYPKKSTRLLLLGLLLMLRTHNNTDGNKFISILLSRAHKNGRLE